MLQKQENKQHQDLIYKSHCAREEQERKFELDMQVIKTENKNIKSFHFEYVLKCRNKESIQALVKHLTVEESFCSAQAGIQKTLPYWTVCRNVMNYTTLHDASMS